MEQKQKPGEMRSEGGLSSTIGCALTVCSSTFIHSFIQQTSVEGLLHARQQPFHERESVLTRFAVKRGRQANKQSDLVFEEHAVNEVQGGE